MQSTWHGITLAAAAKLELVASAQACQWLFNPPWPLDVDAAPGRAIFLLPRGDFLVDQPGQQQERRKMRLVIGAVSLKTKPIEALAEADALHFAARDCLKSLSMRAALLAAGGPHDIREAEVEPQLRDIASPGSLLMSAYELEYFQTYPSFAI